MSLSNKRAKDAAMAKRLSPSPDRWRAQPQNWPYHNNLGTSHDKSKKFRDEADKAKEKG